MAAALQRFKLVVFVPTTHLKPVKQAIFAAGAGQYPKYSECCFVTFGTGSFRPAADANPFLGQAGSSTAEEVAEARLETVCNGEKVVRDAVAALRKVHPYEEVAYDVFRLEDFGRRLRIPPYKRILGLGK